RSSPAISEDGNVYVGSSDGKLYSISAADGTTNWPPFNANSPFVHYSPAVGRDGTIYIANENGKLYAIKGTSRLADGAAWPQFRRNLKQTANADVLPGEQLWAVRASERVKGPAALGADGTVYFFSFFNGYAVLANGKSVWTNEVNLP